MKYTATANINPDRQASVCLIVMGLTVEKQLYLSKRRLMTFPKDPGRQMPKEVTTRAVQIAPQERCTAFAVRGEFVNTGSTLAALTGMGMQASENREWIPFAGVLAFRIDAGKQSWKSAKEHVQARWQQNTPVALPLRKRRKSDQRRRRPFRERCFTKYGSLQFGQRQGGTRDRFNH